MQLPQSSQKKTEEAHQFACSVCCFGTEDSSSQGVFIVPAEVYSARMLHEVPTHTPRTPTGPPPVMSDSLSSMTSDQQVFQALQAILTKQDAFERRLQSSIIHVMEQQYQRLSSELLDVLRRGGQRTKFGLNRSTTKLGRKFASAPMVDRMNGINSLSALPAAKRDIAPTAPGCTPPLLKPGRSIADAADRVLSSPALDWLPGPNLESPVLLTPRSAKLAQHANEKSDVAKGRKARGSPQVAKAQLSKAESKNLGPQKPSPQPQRHECGDPDFLSAQPKGLEHSEHEFLSGLDRAQEVTDAKPKIPKLNSFGTFHCAGTGELDLSYSPSWHLTGSNKRARMTDTNMNDDIILTDLLNAKKLRQQQKRVEANCRNKFKTGGGDRRDSLTGELIQEPCLQTLIKHPFFDSSCALVIVLNAVLIGISVEWLTNHEEETPALIVLGHLCNCFFLGELVVRLLAHRLSYFTNEDRLWNLFDFVLVVFSVVDFLLWATIGNAGAGSVGSTLKIVKMLRIVRIFRVFRFFKELSLLALMIMDSLRSLVWALLMLTIIIYVFAICFTQNATEFMKNEVNEADKSHLDTEVQKHFGSLPKTIYSLVKSMLDGVSWGIVSDALMHMDAFSATLFFFYISFTVLAVLNIITGVFVDNAVETAKTEREFLIQKEMELREKLTLEMRMLFKEMDEDQSGSVNFEELVAFFDDVRVQTYFQALGLDPSDAERLFRLIDTDGSGEVQVNEFLDGCIRLKGEARSIDVHSILWQCRQIQTRLDKLEGDHGESTLGDKPAERAFEEEVGLQPMKIQRDGHSIESFDSARRFPTETV